MAREYVINGETLVRVRGMTGTGIGDKVFELGLATDQITITPSIKRYGVKYDDFGPDTPPEYLWMLADCHIKMTLIHYDDSILDTCIRESMGGGAGDPVAGTFGAAGTPMGGNVGRWQTGNHYITLYLSSPVLAVPWRFRTCYLTEQPFVYPLGVSASAVICNWRAIPYDNYGVIINIAPFIDISSKNVILWDYKDQANDTYSNA